MSDAVRLDSVDDTDTERFVRAIYRGVLGRNADASGLSAWVAAISRGMTPAEVVEAFINSEEHRRAAAIRMFVPPGHFYSPVVNPREAERHFQRVAERHDKPLGVAIDHDAMVAKWNALVPLMKSSPFGEQPRNGHRYGYNNPSYSCGDASIFHAMLRLHKPKRLIEIGSGYSSACTCDTVDLCLNGNLQPHFHRALSRAAF